MSAGIVELLLLIVGGMVLFGGGGTVQLLAIIAIGAFALFGVALGGPLP